MTQVMMFPFELSTRIKLVQTLEKGVSIGTHEIPTLVLVLHRYIVLLNLLILMLCFCYPYEELVSYSAVLNLPNRK